MISLAELQEKGLVIASHNAGKVREIGELLAPLSIKVKSAAELNLDEPEETGATFAANARLKSDAAATASGLPALADDSGLAVDALGGAPGIYSARWAGPEKDFSKAMRDIESKLADTPEAKRSSQFVCVLSLSMPDGRHVEFEGIVEGLLTFPPRGSKGFGYDPIFVPEGETRTFAEMPPEEKHGLSHRAKAFNLLLESFK